MGISFKIDTEEGIIYAIAEGAIGLEDNQAFRKNLLADPNFSTELVAIIEYRMSSIRMSGEENKALAATLPAKRIRKVALVASGPGRESALRYKELVKGKSLVEVFADMWSAKKWVISD